VIPSHTTPPIPLLPRLSKSLLFQGNYSPSAAL
jgi:hypothetical protein